MLSLTYANALSSRFHTMLQTLLSDIMQCQLLLATPAQLIDNNTRSIAGGPLCVYAMGCCLIDKLCLCLTDMCSGVDAMGSKSFRQGLYLELEGCESLLQLHDAHWHRLNNCLQRLLGGRHMHPWQ